MVSVLWLLAVLGMTFDHGEVIFDFFVFGILPMAGLYFGAVAIAWIIEGFKKAD